MPYENSLKKRKCSQIKANKLTLTGPGVVSTLQPESTVLDVASAHTDRPDPRGADPGVGRLATHLVLPLLLENATATTTGPALVPIVPADTHGLLKKLKKCKGERNDKNTSAWSSLKTFTSAVVLY